jgi:hypothetical protein
MLHEEAATLCYMRQCLDETASAPHGLPAVQGPLVDESEETDPGQNSEKRPI